MNLARDCHSDTMAVRYASVGAPSLGCRSLNFNRVGPAILHQRRQKESAKESQLLPAAKIVDDIALMIVWKEVPGQGLSERGAK